MTSSLFVPLEAVIVPKTELSVLLLIMIQLLFKVLVGLCQILKITFEKSGGNKPPNKAQFLE